MKELAAAVEKYVYFAYTRKLTLTLVEDLHLKLPIKIMNERYFQYEILPITSIVYAAKFEVLRRGKLQNLKYEDEQAVIRV